MKNIYKIRRMYHNILKRSIGENENNSCTQIVLKNQYKIMKKIGTLPQLEDTGFKIYSQFEEDGLLLYIFSIIGEGNKTVVEMCCGIGSECMAANLIINHGWDGLLFDGNQKNVDKCIQFFYENPNTRLLCPPQVVKAWITKDNVNELIEERGIKGDISLFSLDIDGNDFHILSALNIISPRVIICETHSFIPSDIAVVMPYKEDFAMNKNSDFYGASTLAMVNLLKKKGYRLIGAHRFGGNCIFMRNDIGKEFFPEISISSTRKHRYNKEISEKRWEKVKECEWEKEENI